MSLQFDEALDYLLSLGHETLAIKLGLTNTKLLLEALDNPQKSFASVQIAGTNGKGSTAVMIDSIARAAGLKIGLYTSPHLIDISERIRICGSDITREDFSRLTEKVRSCAQGLLVDGRLATLPTFFEHLTAIAFLAFAEARVDLATLETGLGGRLDATTTADAAIVAITPIAMDHQEYLGWTLREIAAEKAAIIRPGVTAIVSPQPPEALDVILERCAEVGVVPHLNQCEIRSIAADESGRVTATFNTRDQEYANVCLGMRGRHQATNATVAIMISEALLDHGFSIRHESVIEGLESAAHAGRLQLLHGQPPFLLDGAHNPAGALALREFLEEFIKQPVTLVFGAMQDKDLAEIAAALFPRAEQLILTRPSNARAAALETISRTVPCGFDSSRITLAPTVIEAVNAAKIRTPADGIVCVAGSLYLVGEVLELLGD